MKPIRPLPSNRTLEQLQNHYFVERGIADRLRNADREERKHIYATMYDELFAKVPDHPRLTLRASEHGVKKANKSKMMLVGEFLKPSTTFVEFAPGDCRFAMEVAKHVKKVYAIDISDQRGDVQISPKNLELIIYDGYQLDGIPGNSADVVFSDQFLEHLHPEDTRLHLEVVHRLLKPGGKYVFRTPHAFNGPHDISRYFSKSPEGFHMKEWTYNEFKPVLKSLNYSRLFGIWKVRGLRTKMPYRYFQVAEYLIGWLPSGLKRALSKVFVPSICIVAVK